MAYGVLCEVGFVTRRGGSFSDHETPYFLPKEESQTMTKIDQEAATRHTAPESKRNRIASPAGSNDGRTIAEHAERWIIACEGEGMTEEKAREEAKRILYLHPESKLFLCEIREEICMEAKTKRY